MSVSEYVIAEILRAAEKGLGVDSLVKLEEDARDALNLAEAAHELYQRGLMEAEHEGNIRRDREVQQAEDEGKLLRQEVVKAVGRAIRNSENLTHMFNDLREACEAQGIDFIYPMWYPGGIIDTPKNQSILKTGE